MTYSRDEALRFSVKVEMRRRVGLTDFKELPETVFHRRATGVWVKCDRYEIREGEIVAVPDRVRGLHKGLADEDDEGWIVYDPIVGVPDLFLRFARLYGEPDFDRAALDFA